MTIFRGKDSVTGGSTAATAAQIVEGVASSSASAASALISASEALVSASEALVSANSAEDNAILTAADVVFTNADVVSTGDDVIASAASALAALNSENAASASALSIPAYPTLTSQALNFVRLNAGETAMEFRTPANVLADIGAEAADGTILKDADIGDSVQGYDVDTAKLDVVQTFTAAQEFNAISSTAGDLNLVTNTALSDAAATLTASQLIGGEFTITPTAARILTTDTATNIISALSGSVDNSNFEFTVINLAAFDVTIAVGAGVTLVGNMVVNDGSATFRVRSLTSSTVSITRLETGTRTEVENRVIRVTSISAIEAYSAPVGYVFSLNAGGRSGTFDVIAGDFYTELAADTLNGIYVGLADNATATTKVAKRRFSGRVSVLWFGADNTNATDASAAITAAFDFCTSTAPNMLALNIDPGDYLIETTVVLDLAIDIYGTGAITNGTRIFAGATLNAPMFDVSARVRFFDLTILGTPANENQTAARIRSTNDVSFNRVSFYRHYNSLVFDGVDPIFYVSINQCMFEDSASSFIKIANTSDAGVDLIINSTRFLGDCNSYGFWFQQGLGSIIADNLQISITGALPEFELVLFQTPAPLYGGSQFSNCVFEGGTTRFIGTEAFPWGALNFSNCLFTGFLDNAIQIDNVDDLNISNSIFSSSNTDGIVKFTGSAISQGVVFASCVWEGTGTAPSIYAPIDSYITLSISDPSWDGSAEFINFSNTPNEQLKLSVLGGTVGTSATPIILADYKNTEKNVQVFGFNQGVIQSYVYTGTLDGSGAATITHGIVNAQKKVLSVGAWYKGGSGQMEPLTLGSIDGNNFSVSGGGTSSQYRVTLFYYNSVDPAW